MPTRSKFDAEKLRDLITDGKTWDVIESELKVSTNTLNNHLLKLIQLDGKVYTIAGTGVRNTVPKVTKNGLKISMTLLESYGFAKGDVKIERLGDKEIKITQIG